MNKFAVTVSHIDSVDTLNIITFMWGNITIKMVSLDVEEELNIGDHVVLGVNFTSVAIAKGSSTQLSYINQINASISSVEKGKLLSVVTINCHENNINSLLVTDSVERMDLQTGDEIIMIIKANDIFLLGSA